jgi:hypothetical protein
MSKKILIIVSAFIFVACAANRGPEELRYDAKKDWLLKDLLTVDNSKPKSSRDGLSQRSMYLFKNTIVRTSSNGGFGFMGLQSNVKMGYFDFTETNLQFKSVEGVYEGQESANVINPVVVQWPATHHDVRLDVNEGRITNQQIDDDFKRWDQKKYIEVDFNEPSIGEEQTLPYTPAVATTLECWTLASRERVRDSLELNKDDGYFSFLVEAVYKQNPLCSQSISKHHDSDFTYTVHYRYSFRRLEDSNYQPLEFLGGEEDPARYRYGYFQTVKAEKDSSAPGGRKNRFFVNRWDPNKKHYFYFANGTPERFKPVFRDIFAQTNEIFAKTGRSIRFEIHDYNYNHETGKNDGYARQFGDLRYSFVNIVDELDPTSPLGYGPSDAHPRTGELLAANTMIWTGSLDYYLTVLDKLARDPEQKFDRSLYQKMLTALSLTDPDVSQWGTQWDMKNSRIGQAYQKLVDRTAFNIGANSYTAAKEGVGINVPVVWLSPAQKGSSDEAMVSVLDNLSVIPGVTPSDYSNYVEKLFDNIQLASGQDAFVPKLFNQRDIFNDPRFAQIVSLMKSRQPNASMIESATAEIDKAVKHNHLEVEMNSKGHCVYPMMAAISGGEPFLDGKNKQEILDSIVYRVSIHEFGHNLNLRHNFYGTIDNANFRLHESPESAKYLEKVKLSAEEIEKTNPNRFVKVGGELYWAQVSSSVMDYLRLQDEYTSPKTWEDYDRAAIFYAYSGGKELTPDREYLFCTDEQTLTSALCNRFDIGSTPSEVLLSLIDTYETGYALHNYRNGRAFWDTSGYAGRIFTQMWSIKEFYPLWKTGFANDIVNNTLSEMGIVDEDQKEVNEVINREMKKVMRLSMAFYQSVLQQSAAQRPWQSVYDERTGAIKRIGIGSDKVYAMMFLAGDDSYPYNPNRYMFHQSYLTHAYDSDLDTFSKKIWENVVTSRVAMEPSFISYGRLLYAISARNFYNRDTIDYINQITTLRYDERSKLNDELGIDFPSNINAKLFKVTKNTADLKIDDEVVVLKIDENFYVVPKEGSPYAYSIARDAISTLNSGSSTVQNKIDLEELWLLSKFAKGSPL